MKHSFATHLREPSIISEEQKRKMAEGRNRSKRMYPNSKKVAQINSKTDEIINIFSSINEAARTVGCNSSSIKDVLNPNKSCNTCKGYKWKEVI